MRQVSHPSSSDGWNSTQPFDPELTYAIEPELLATYRRMIEQQATRELRVRMEEPTSVEGVETPPPVCVQPPRRSSGRRTFNSHWAPVQSTPQILAELDQRKTFYSTPVYTDIDIEQAKDLWIQRMPVNISTRSANRHIVSSRTKKPTTARLSRPAFFGENEHNSAFGLTNLVRGFLHIITRRFIAAF